MPRLEPGLATQIAALGADLTAALVQGTRALLAPLAVQPDRGRCSIERNVAYGDDARHRLDIFRPQSPAARPAVLAYVHGGGFVGGSKGGEGELFFDNFGAWASNAGNYAATINYRLAPQSTWPAGAQDVSRAVDWIAENLARAVSGIMPIFLIGQSAGAVHVADYLAGNGGKLPCVDGGVMLSGIFDFTRHKPLGFERSYYGEMRGATTTYSTLQNLAQCSTPCLFTVSQFDPPPFRRQAHILVEATIDAVGHPPRIIDLAGHNHLSPAYHLGATGDVVGPEILAFIENVATRAAELRLAGRL